MNPADWAIHRARIVVFATTLLALAGAWAFLDMGKLEDPDFTVRTALVQTAYPGARASRVEEEVTEVLERHIQQLDALDELESVSRAGESVIYVHVDEALSGQRLRQVWDELNKKVQRATVELPDGILGPLVNDDYGDVFGTLLAVTGEDYTHRELHDYADELRREILRLPGVARAELFGERGERVFVETRRARLAALGLHPGQIIQALQGQNVVAQGGAIDLGDDRLRMFVSGVFESVEDVRNLAILNPETGERLYLRDFAEVARGYADPPERMLRFNGRPAIALGVSPREGVNVVRLGDDVLQRLEELKGERPVGIEVAPINFQPATVRAAIVDFGGNLATAVAIVLAVLLVALGWRTGLIVGMGVPVTILATFFVMWAAGIDLHRVSLGALIVVLGMLVDNAIVVAELMMTKMQRGIERLQAAREAVGEAAGPLLIGTLIAALAFSPISMTPTVVGEFTRSLFWVVAIALGLSWLLAISVVALLGYRYLRVPPRAAGADSPESRWLRGYRRVLGGMLRHRSGTLTAVAGALLVAALASMAVPRIFFPPAERDQFTVDHWRGEGTRIESTAADVARLESYLAEHPQVENTTSLVGEGLPRFYLPMILELPNPAFAQVLVQVSDPGVLDPVMADVRAWMGDRFPDALPRVRPMQLGDPVRYPVELRLSGDGDPGELRRLAEAVVGWLDAHSEIVAARHNWRDRNSTLDVAVDQDRVRAAGLSSAEVAETLEAGFSGRPIGVFRDGDKTLPILWRFPETERSDLSRIDTLEIWPRDGGAPVPLRQVARVDIGWDDAAIWRHDRRRAITVQADPAPGVNAERFVRAADAAVAQVLAEAGASPRVEREWVGEFEASQDAQASVLAPVPFVLVLIALLLLWQFNSYRNALVAGLTVPLAVIGVVAGLLLFRQPFGFIALLGTMSLAGMLLRNAIVLVEQVELFRRNGRDAATALVEASVSRFRPVVLAALTTILGMIPLALSGPFWAPLAIAVMSGLAVGTVLILGVVPVLYATFHRIPPESTAADG
ncbi:MULTISPECIES: efflux RND transporter permease subunit [unclassified Thioalkalivibrio]|uniref:efflux RND transporter permease subunit n=1 Tax=unclassified Thioalkalivibrio TaxID=2621013 RepID=UPI0003741841|nr:MULTISPECIES: efflux RND transporter permease subunit [unclassified Thioalkalivibrio]